MANISFEDFKKKFNFDLEKKRAQLFPLLSENSKLIHENVTSNIFLACLVRIKDLYTYFFKEIEVELYSKSRIHAFTQINFDGRVIKDVGDIPDGMLVITDKNDNLQWAGLIEFKTASSLTKNKVESYLKIVKSKYYPFNALITISNDYVSNPLHNPFNISGKYHHFSWTRIFSILQYIIKTNTMDENLMYLSINLCNYLNELGNLSKSKKTIKTFDKMNDKWEDFVNIVSDKKIKPKNKEVVIKVCNDWVQEEQDLGLKLLAKYGRKIELLLNLKEKEKKSVRIDTVKENIYKEQKFKSIYKVYPLLKSKTDNMNYPFCISKTIHLKIKNEINIISKSQIITFEVEPKKNIEELFNNKSMKKVISQVETFLSPFKKDLKLNKKTRLSIILESKNEIGEQSLFDYLDLYHNNMLNFDITVDRVRKYKISAKFNLEYIFNNAKFISEIENNFETFYSNYLVPFIK